MEQSDVTLQQLVEVGAHFGHRVWKCNPKMLPYIFEERRGISIIDLRKTLVMLRKALVTLHNTATLGGQILFVSTRKQNSEMVKEAALRTAQFYTNHRWLGGTLTNWGTVGLSCNRLAELERDFDKKSEGLTKKERLRMARERDKMRRTFDGIKDLRGLPALLIVPDVNKDRVAVNEAKRLNIPVIGLIDSDSDIELASFPVPANDDSKKTVAFLLKLFGDAILGGLKKHLEDKEPKAASSKQQPEAVAEKAPAKSPSAKVSPKSAKKTVAEKPETIQPKVETVPAAEESKTKEEKTEEPETK